MGTTGWSGSRRTSRIARLARLLRQRDAPPVRWSTIRDASWRPCTGSTTKQGFRYVEASWDDALADIAARCKSCGHRRRWTRCRRRHYEIRPGTRRRTWSSSTRGWTPSAHNHAVGSVDRTPCMWWPRQCSAPRSRCWCRHRSLTISRSSGPIRRWARGIGSETAPGAGAGHCRQQQGARIVVVDGPHRIRRLADVHLLSVRPGPGLLRSGQEGHSR